MTVENFKQGLFSLNSRRFGTIAEIIGEKIYQLHQSSDDTYDRLDDSGNKIEVKSARVLISHQSPINSNSIFEECYKAISDSRGILFDDREKHKFGCNIQQIKPELFDKLIYMLFFQDRVCIFRINSTAIAQLNGYCPTQHRGNIGEGQFSVTHSNITYHLSTFIDQIFSYETLMKILGGDRTEIIDGGLLRNNE